METKRLIPYSVHLPEPIYKKLKVAAGERKASALVRDAITMIIEGGPLYASGYNKALEDAIDIVKSDKATAGMIIGGKEVTEVMVNKILKLQMKEKSSGTKKSRGNWSPSPKD